MTDKTPASAPEPEQRPREQTAPDPAVPAGQAAPAAAPVSEPPRHAPEKEASLPQPEPSRLDPWAAFMDKPAAVPETKSAPAGPAPSGMTSVEARPADAHGGPQPAGTAAPDFVLLENNAKRKASDPASDQAAASAPEGQADAEQTGDVRASARDGTPVEADPARDGGTPSPDRTRAASPKAAVKSRRAGPFGGNALGPLLRAEPMFRKEPGGEWVPVPPTGFSRVFSVLAFFPLLPLILLLAAQVAFTLDTRALWYSDEVRYANAFQNMVQAGHWLVLQLNEAPYPDKPPLFFWFLNAIRIGAAHLVPGGIPGGSASPLLFSIGMAVSGLLFLLAAHALAFFVARVDSRTSLAAGIILLTGFFFSGLLHYLRMDILFAACITVSHVFLYHGWMRPRALMPLVIGYFLAGTAVLIKGPLGLAFPLLAGICFLLWQGRITRFFRPDNLLGLLIGLAVPGAWLVAAWMTAGDPFLDNILGKQILSRALHTWHHAQPWYHYLLTFPLIWLPWTLLLLFLPWTRLFSRPVREAVKASRTPEKAGLAYLWCAFVPGFVLLSLVSIKLPIYCLPLFPPLAVLSARALLRLSPLAGKCLRLTLAIVLFALALLLLLAPVLPQSLLPIPTIPDGTIILGGICLVFACALAFLGSSRRPEGMLLILALFMAAFSYPAWTVSAPSLDPFMSPKAQALTIKTYRDAGYYPAAYKLYGGTYSYYAGVVHDIDEWSAFPALAARHPKLILALRASFWDKLTDKPAGFSEVHRQTIAERDYVLVARPPLPTAGRAAPAPRPETAPAGDAGKAPAQPPAKSQPATPEPAAPDAGKAPAPDETKPAAPATPSETAPRPETAPAGDAGKAPAQPPAKSQPESRPERPATPEPKPESMPPASGTV